MLILTIRTDNPEAELGLFEGTKQLAYQKWPAGRELAATVHQKLAVLLAAGGQHSLQELQGIVAFQGPGSFTGLRIGLSVANALAYALHIPIVGATGDDWQKAGLTALLSGKNDATVLPEYGAPVHITQQKK